MPESYGVETSRIFSFNLAGRWSSRILLWIAMISGFAFRGNQFRTTALADFMVQMTWVGCVAAVMFAEYSAENCLSCAYLQAGQHSQQIISNPTFVTSFVPSISPLVIIQTTDGCYFDAFQARQKRKL